MKHWMLFKILTVFLSFTGAYQIAQAEIDPYVAGITEAATARKIRNDAEFQKLTVIDSSKTHTFTVSDGMGGSKTINAVNLITLTNYTAPYVNASDMQRYTVDATSNYRSNLWTTIEGDVKNYLQKKRISITNNTNTTYAILESLGMGDWSGYKVLSVWVESKYITRPSYNPDIASNSAPVWNETTGSYDFRNVSEITLPNFLGIAPVNKSADRYTRPFDAYIGNEEYQNWLNAWSTSSYDIGAGREFPYTGLGWTWNWNPNPSLKGNALSEFIVNGNAEYYFKCLRPTLAYLFPLIARNANQSSVANALDSSYDSATGDMRTTLDNIVALDDGEAIANTFEETSPARLNVLNRQIVAGIGEMVDTVSERFGHLNNIEAAVDESKNETIWTSSSVSSSNGWRNTTRLGSDATSTMFVLGWEKRKVKSVSGITISSNNQDLIWNEFTGNADAVATFLTAYSGINSDKWTLGALFGLGLVNSDTHRLIPTLNQRLSGDHSTTGMFLGIRAYQPIHRNNWTLTPSVGLLYSRLDQEAYTESGGSLAMSIDSRTINVLCGEIGVSAENWFKSFNNRNVTQLFKLRWLSPLSNRNATISGSFSDNPASQINGSDSTVSGNTILVSYAISGEYGIDRKLSMGYEYRKELDGEIINHRINLNYAVDF